MASVYSKIERLKKLVVFFILKYKPACFFCEKKIEILSFFPKLSGKKRDDYTIHHKDENRSNNKPANLVICHRSCHRQYHRLRQLGQIKKKLR